MQDYNPYAAPGAPSAAAAPTGGPPPLAGRSARLVASVVDAVVQLAAGVPALILWGGLPILGRFAAWKTMPPWYNVLDYVLGLGAQAYFWATRAQSIGKMALGIRIVRVADQRPASLARILLVRTLPLMLLGGVPGVVRWFRHGVESPGVVWVFLGIMMADVLAIFGPRRRCLHDYVAGTEVRELPRVT